MKKLELKHLKKYYGNSLGIEDISLSLNEGEIYGFIGPNGAGKSTTIRTIVGLINKTSGRILLNGKELNSDDINIKKKIGYLPSEVNLYNDMLVKDILKYHESFFKKDLSKRKNELVKWLKVDVEKKIEDLSLGNLKKVGIILSLMHEPEILILDEPTSGLDPIMQSVLHNLLLEEKEKGTTILYSSHVLSEVSNLCDRVGIIKDGIIIKEDTINNIKKNSLTYLIIDSKEIDSIISELKLKILNRNGNEVTFINNIDVNKLIGILAKYDINDIHIVDVPLEELFIDYYK